MEKVCVRCGVTFDRSKKLSNEQWLNRKFCSKRCSGSRSLLTDEEIIRMYLNEKMSSTDISKKAGVSSVQVLRILRSNDIDVRSLSEGKMLSHSKPSTRMKLSIASSNRRLSDESKDKLRKRTGERNHNWKGGLTLSSQGYLQFTNSKGNGEHSGKLLHVLIAEWTYNRKVKKGEHVHHIDGNKLNNDPHNIELISASEHAKLHAKERLDGKRSKQT